MSAEQVILYDLPSRGPGAPASWSPNVLKARLALNMKGIPYKTEWVNYPDLDERLTKEGSPRASEWPYQTSPTVKFPGGKIIKDSAEIVNYIESDIKPSPQLKINDPKVQEITNKFLQTLGPVVPVHISQVPRTFLDERNAKYFYDTRKTRFEKPLEELEKVYVDPDSKESKQAWANVHDAAKAFDELMGPSKGPFALGSEASWADIVIVSFLFFFKSINPISFQRAIEITPVSGRMATIWQASQPWFEKLD